MPVTDFQPVGFAIWPTCWYYRHIDIKRIHILYEETGYRYTGACMHRKRCTTMKRKIVIGVLAHVDAGKTTLSESLLYLSGRIRKLGRVDNKDAYLDNYDLERARGITIFSKQAVFDLEDTQITLLDTPGHIDFSTEMERTLQVLDYAILVVSGADGVQGHTRTLWRLLEIYDIPVFLFINKMDQNGTDKGKVLDELTRQLDDRCIDFGQAGTEFFFDQLAMCDEELMEAYLKTGQIDDRQIRASIIERNVFPCFFGSALRLEGIEAFIDGIVRYSDTPLYPEEFGAKTFKIGRDEQGNRLTYMKITGGVLKARDILSGGGWEEKVNQIRIYSGQKFEVVNEAEAGTVCAVTGLSRTKPGEGLGIEESSGAPILEPVLSYRIILPEGNDPRVVLPKLRQLEEEDPALRFAWDEQLREIRVQVMGEVQLEILQSIVKTRFDLDVSFDSGSIVYKETIADTAEGVGHFEPLRHYAEVHLLLEPAERGSGLQFTENCSDDILAKSWKNLVLTHLTEKAHKGVLTGSEITDMKITLVSGRAHNKHTEGGDFREATYRAVRQGLKEAGTILLEPYYSFSLELPDKLVGRAMADIEKMYGTCRLTRMEGDMAVLEGYAPVVTMRNYQKEVTAYTKGSGRLFCSLMGYERCHNTEEVVAMTGYDSERDADNPTGSIFCANGAGFFVSWDQVKSYMHVEGILRRNEEADDAAAKKAPQKKEKWMSPEEVDRIFKLAHLANQGKKNTWKRKWKTVDGRKRKTAANRTAASRQEAADRPDTEGKRAEAGRPAAEAREEYLLVDGYNIIFSWPELKKLAEDNMDSARSKLIDQLSRYQNYRKCRIIAVFDAYRVERHSESVIDIDNIHVVFTREAQTADQFIEKFAHDNQKKYKILVATSDGLQQIIIRGAGCTVLSAGDLKKEIDHAGRRVLQAYQDKQTLSRNYLRDSLPEGEKRKIAELFNNESNDTPDC